MAFKLTKRPRLHKRDYFDEIGALILSLTFRELTPEELDAYDLALAKIRNNPVLSEDEKIKARKEEQRKIADLAIVDWGAVEDDDEKPIALTPESVQEFTMDPATEKFWQPYIANYLNPWIRQGKVEGEKRLDPHA
ncbi:hypothetical protein D3C87_655900 [compost metagenome]